MTKTDFRKEMKEVYGPSAKDFTIVDMPAICYLMVDGKGDPNAAKTFKDAIEALYAASYTLKFASKNTLGRDYVVPPLEDSRWAADMSDFVRRKKDHWLWTMMIMVPEWIKPPMISTAVETARAKKSLPALSVMRHEMLHEGKSVQILHIGSYDDEGPVLARLHHEYLPANGLACNGKHHEVYLTDARKTPAEKLRTILRQPVKTIGIDR